MKRLFAVLICLAMALPLLAQSGKKIKTLFLDGRSVHHKHWEEWVEPLKSYLNETGRFALDHVRCPAPGEDISTFNPNFKKYDLIVSIIDDVELWQPEVRKRFEQFISSGGGLVVVHAADNSFPSWPEYNEMIGLGGWGGRSEKDGPYVYYNKDGELVRDTSPGRGGHHGAQHSFQVQTRMHEHPIMKGLPEKWMHAKDELYEQLRGPAKNMDVLATAYASPEFGGSDRHEPILMTIQYGKGRVFHTVLGHSREAMSSVGFITTYQRGAEWAATGKVSIPVPIDFPGPDKVSQRPFKQ